MAGAAADAFPQLDVLLKGDCFAFLAVQPDGETDAVVGQLGDVGTVDRAAFRAGVCLGLEVEGPGGKFNPLPPADDHAHDFGSSGFGSGGRLGSLLIFLRRFFLTGIRHLM